MLLLIVRIREFTQQDITITNQKVNFASLQKIDCLSSQQLQQVVDEQFKQKLDSQLKSEMSGLSIGQLSLNNQELVSNIVNTLVSNLNIQIIINSANQQRQSFLQQLNSGNNVTILNQKIDASIQQLMTTQSEQVADIIKKTVMDQDTSAKGTSIVKGFSLDFLGQYVIIIVIILVIIGVPILIFIVRNFIMQPTQTSQALQSQQQEMRLFTEQQEIINQIQQLMK